jgi:hypothetical protein
MAILSPARRVARPEDLERAGDYTGPAEIQWGDETRLRVMFLLPVHQGADRFDYGARQGSGQHMITQPPWTFRECPDGSLEIGGSIGCGPEPYYWHGYLDEGNTWRQV